tara:strand:- start:79 stop:354 length:276 start_codon:yes stop_codon:yes gene_type:complete
MYLQARRRRGMIWAYLGGVFPEPQVSPVDPLDRARTRTWTRRPEDGVHRACATVTAGGGAGGASPASRRPVFLWLRDSFCIQRTHHQGNNL